MNTGTILTDESATRRQLVVHTRHAVVCVPLTGDQRLDELLARVARRGGACVIAEQIIDDAESTP